MAEVNTSLSNRALNTWVAASGRRNDVSASTLLQGLEGAASVSACKLHALSHDTKLTCQQTCAQVHMKML